MAKRETVVYDGVTYSRWPESKRKSDRVYYRPTIKLYLEKKKDYLHRQVWIDSNGAIPDGFHIHHIDENPSNNDISNLECLSPFDHLSNHHKYSEERLLWQVGHLDSIRHLTKEWHASPEGIDWHRSHAYHLHKHDPVIRNCECCGSEFSDKTVFGKFCSNKCRAKARRDSGVDNIKSICAVCGSEFEHNKYNKQTTCSRSCTMKMRWGDNK